MSNSLFSSKPSLLPLLGASTLALVAGCGGDPASTPIALQFEARVGSAPFACGQTYEGIGTTETSLTTTDLRFYVHDVRLVTSAGVEVPVTLEDDGAFQTEGVALLDFEDGGECEGGNVETHTTLTGSIPASETFTALRFRVGLPESLNHLDVASQPSPLNVTSMYWSWTSGYKFLRFEGQSTGQPTGFFFHLGSTDCAAGTGCEIANRPELEVALPSGFDASTHTFVIDLAHWLEGVDLDTDAGGAPGCMSGVDDPECTAWFEAVGLPDASTQRFVSVEAP